MKRIIAGIVGLIFSVQVVATGFPFQPHQVLSSADLNAALQTAAITSGSIGNVSITNSAIANSTGSFTTLTSPSVGLTGGLINGIAIGSVSPSTGSFTTLASPSISFTGGTASGVAITNSTGSFTTLASPSVSLTGGAITGTPISGSTGSFTTLAASSASVSGTLAAASNVTVAGTLAAASNVTVAGTLSASAVGVTNTLTASAVTVTGTLSVPTLSAPTLTATNTVNTPSLNGGQLAGYRNRIINSGFPIAQVAGNNPTTIVAGAGTTLAQWQAFADIQIDGFYALCTGANVTGQRVAGTLQDRYFYQFTGAASVTGIEFGQRIEAANSYDLNGTTATLSVELANSLLTSVTWTAYYANTTDTFGYVGAYTRTQIATGTFTVSPTLGVYSAQIAIPAAATTGIEIVLSVGAQTSGTWTIGEVQLEPGSIATAMEHARVDDQLRWSQRYLPYFSYPAGSTVYEAGGFSSASAIFGLVNFNTPARVAPSAMVNSTVGNFTISNSSAGASAAATSVSLGFVSDHNARVSFAAGAVFTANQTGLVYVPGTAGYIYFTGAQL